MGVGRFFCVALPFILSVGSLIFLLIACLGGVTNKDLYMFRVDIRDLEIGRSEIQNLAEGALDDISSGEMPTFPGVGGSKVKRQDDDSDSDSDSSSGNFTAKQLGLDNIYDVALWGYCTTDSDDERTCTDAEFDWANKNLNTSWIDAVGDLSGGSIELPEEVSDALETFQKVVKWTQVAYIIAFIGLALTVIFGIFANCTRIMSCVTFIVAWVAGIAVCAAASLSTATSVVVVGAVKGLSDQYGVDSAFNNGFLALVWISAALALGASFFWLFTICCCSPDRTKRSKTRGSVDGEKLISGNSSYQPIGGSPNPGAAGGGYYNAGAAGNPYGGGYSNSYGRNDMAYEPYSHRN